MDSPVSGLKHGETYQIEVMTGLPADTGEKTIEVPIPASIQSAPGHHLILFAQTPGNGRVLGIDTKPL